MRIITVASLFFYLACGAALADEGQIEIGPTSVFPIVISQPGSYLLTANLSLAVWGDVIQIDADNVTLDLGGHTITGAGPLAGSNGITNLSTHGGITVRNGTIQSFGRCLNFGGPPAYPNRIEDVQVSLCREGITVMRTMVAGASASQCTLYGLIADEGSIVAFSTARGNGTGFTLYDSLCTSCTAVSNSDYGFRLTSSTCSECAAKGNSTFGFYFPGNGNLLISCNASANTSGSVSGSCSTGNACVNSLLP